MLQTLDWYKYFLSVARLGSVTRAARDMHVSQPAVSLAIAKLEDELGVKLFVRTNRGIRLTNEGEILAEHLSGALNMIETGETRLREIAGLRSGTLRIGASDMTLRYFLLDYIEWFHMTYPEIKLTVSNAPTPLTLKALHNGEIDFGVISEPISERDLARLDITPVREIRDIFVCQDKFLPPEPLAPSELAKLPLILLEEGTSTRRALDAFLGETAASASIELATSDLLLEFARRGFGVAGIVEDFALPDLEAGRLFRLPLTHSPAPRRFLAVSARDLPLSAAATAMLSRIKQCVMCQDNHK